MIADLPPELAAAFPVRPVDLHKYGAGTVAVVGGSREFASAPVFAALGARSAGAGLVRMAAPEASRAVAAVLVPEAVFAGLSAQDPCPAADVTVGGMGIGVARDTAAMMEKCLFGGAERCVADADALALLARRCSAGACNRAAGQRLVLTPHAAEAARLLGCTTADIAADRPGAAREIAARYRATAVLKGAGTIVADEDGKGIWTCQAGNPFMAVGGMGDLLAGMIAARWAYLVKRRPEAADAANLALAVRSAVWLHAAAADSLAAAERPVEPCVAAVAAAAASARISFERIGRG